MAEVNCYFRHIDKRLVMKNILLILVGGTICTAVNEHGTLSVCEGAGVTLKENYLKSDSPFAGKVEITLSKNLFILSENMTVDKWNLMIKTYKEELSKDEYDGVIFAHGTDTLAYSSALFSMLLSGTEIPVFFVSSNARLDLPRANGNHNFRCAVECICRGIQPNVYAVYKNISDGRMYLHLGSRLLQCGNYSEDFFSKGSVDITDVTDKDFYELNKALMEKYPSQGKKSFVEIKQNFALKDCVLMLQPYVGMNYSAIDYSKFSAILHTTYHSGTACAEKTEHCEKYGVHSMLYLLDKCAECGADVYITPSKNEGEVYDTVRIMGTHNNNQLEFFYGTTTETAYAKLLIAYSVFDNKNEIQEFFNSEINFELIEK